VPNYRPVFRVVDGDPKTPYDVDPIWSQPDVGQEVLMANNGRVYVLEEINEEFMTDREKAKLKADGRLVKREDELRTVSRRMRILDINTGRLMRPEWDINLADFPFVRGSMQQRDPAIYLGTRDGYVFKVYGQSGRSAGGK
jgi:hypothetical protein